jgi:excinuclease ABC subunit A
VVATGTPEAVARVEASYTGQYLRDLLPDVGLEGPRSGTRADVAEREQATGAGDD